MALAKRSAKVHPIEMGVEKAPSRQSRRFMRKETNPWASTSLDFSVNGEKSASIASGDILAGESNDPTLTLINYLNSLLKSTDEEIDFDHMQSLIDNGADVNAVSIETGLSVLQTVSINWDSSVALFLIDRGANIHQADQKGRTCLHFAATYDHTEMVECLLSCGCDIENKTFEEQQTPIHYAVRSNSLNALTTLVEHKGNYEARDYNGRTPLHLAAELDRTYAAKYLLSLDVPAECRVVENNKTPLLATMIRTMPGVANLALNQLQFFVPSERKQFFLLSYLEPNPNDRKARKIKTPLEVAVELERFEILDHPVMKELIVQKWKSFAHGYFLFYFFLYLAFLATWSILIAFPSVQEKHRYEFPKDIWRILFEIVALVLFFNQIGEEINESLRSKTLHNINKAKLMKTLENDLAHTNSCFPEEKKYLTSELRRVKKSSSNYFKDPENYVDLLTFAVLFVIIILHLLDVFAHSEELALWVARVSCFGAILIWVRLLKFLSAFKQMGPLIAIVRSLIVDIGKYFLLYGVFFVPYTICFFVLFGGSQSASLEGAEDLTTYQRVLVMCFRMSLIDDYPFETMRTVDEYMAAILVVTFLLFTAMIGLNLFIALLSNTFKTIYDNAQANAEMQRAAIILSMQEKALEYWYKKYLHHIHTNCNPTFKYYDDDDLPMPAGGNIQETAACNKTKQLANDIASRLEHTHSSVSGDLAHVSGQIKYFSDALVTVQDYQEQGMQYLSQQLDLVKKQLSSLEGTGSMQHDRLPGSQPTSTQPLSSQNVSSTQSNSRTLPQIVKNGHKQSKGDSSSHSMYKEDNSIPRHSQGHAVAHLLKEIFPNRHTPSNRVHQHRPHVPQLLLSPVHSEVHLHSATSSRASLLDQLSSQPSYVTVNHRRYRTRDEGEIRREQWQSKIQRVVNED